MLHDSKDVGTRRRDPAVKVPADESGGPEHEDWSAQVLNG